MKIDNATVDRIAMLSRLQFNGEEKENIKGDLNKIIDFIDKLNELDTDDVEPLMFITEELNVVREDEVKNEVPQKDALQNGPDTNSDYFRVPKVIENPDEK